MHYSIPAFHVLLALVSIGAATTTAQDKTAEIDKIFSWVAPDGPGAVVAASQHGEIVVNRAYGLADLERGVPMTLNNGRKLDYARGLMLDTNYAGSVIWHAGSAAAYKAVLSRFPERGFSIAILSKEAGKVVALELSNPVLRKIKFTRASDTMSTRLRGSL
jgi:hypothetical protein